MEGHEKSSAEILKENIAATREELPFSLTPNDLLELLPYEKTTIYEMLRKKQIPSRRVRGRIIIPRDWFLAWYYGDEQTNDRIEDYQIKRVK